MAVYTAGTLLNISTEPSGFVVVSSGANVDPTLVQLKISVNGVHQATSSYTGGVASGPYTIVRQSVGQYFANVDTTGLPGTWLAEWISDPDGTSPQLCQAIIATGFVVVGAPV
jgi:hypothetical protein